METFPRGSMEKRDDPAIGSFSPEPLRVSCHFSEALPRQALFDILRQADGGGPRPTLSAMPQDLCLAPLGVLTDGLGY